MAHPPSPSAVDLLEHAAFVRAVARAAVRGDDEVDDVVQETWLSALRADEADVERPRGWLGAVVHRRAADRARSAGRRRERERRAARPEALEPTADVVARAEIAQRLARAVLALDDPYRTSILLRYFDDLAPREIAERTGVPVETARTRVKRGLARLREALDAGHGGRRATWLSALVPLLPAGPVPTGSAASGGWIAAKKNLLGGVVLVGGLLYVLMDRVSAPGAAGWYGLACLLLVATALGFMTSDLVRARGRRGGAVARLLVAFAYLAANVATFLFTLSADRFAIFDRGYVVAVSVGAPVFVLAGLVVLVVRRRRAFGLGTLGFALWILGVAFAHFWVVAQASASV